MTALIYCRPLPSRLCPGGVVVCYRPLPPSIVTRFCRACVRGRRGLLPTLPPPPPLSARLPFRRRFPPLHFRGVRLSFVEGYARHVTSHPVPCRPVFCCISGWSGLFFFGTWPGFAHLVLTRQDKIACAGPCPSSFCELSLVIVVVFGLQAKYLRS